MLHRKNRHTFPHKYYIQLRKNQSMIQNYLHAHTRNNKSRSKFNEGVAQLIIYFFKQVPLCGTSLLLLLVQALLHLG